MKNENKVLSQTNVSGCSFDSLGNELKEGDVFEYSSKKWKSRERILSKNGILCTMVTERDMPDKFIPLEKYLKRHYVIKVS